MTTTLRWRRCAGFKVVCAALAALMLLGPATAGAWPGRTARIAFAGQTAPRGVAAAARPQPLPAPAAPAVVPRRLRPQSLELISAPQAVPAGDPWSWFDGSRASGFGAGGTVRVRATLANPTKLVALGAWGGSAGVLSVSVERDGTTAPVEGLAAIDLGARSDGWHEFAAREQPYVRSLVIEWRSRGEGGPRELELWGLGAVPGAALAELADELHAGLPSGAVEIAAAPGGAQIVPPARSGAAFVLDVAADPRAFERAFLVYELEGLSHWTFVPRELNGRHGPARRPIAEMGDDAGQGGLQVEEIAPSWLHRGANALVFLPIPERSYTVRRARIVVVGSDDLRAARVDRAGREWDLGFRERVQPQHVAFRLSAPTTARIALRAPAAGGEAASIDLAGLEPGWHWAPVGQLPATDRIRATVSDARAAAAIDELSIAASPEPASPGARPRLVVSYPLHDECSGPGAYLRGFVDPGTRLVANPAHQLPSAAEPETDGSFALAVPSPAGPAVDVVAETADGQRLRRHVAVGPCLAGPGEIADVMAPGGKRQLREDAGAPFGAVVAAGEARTLSFGGATVEIPKGAVDRDVRITIRSLVPSQVQPMDSLMENVVPGGRGYRFGPLGMVFRKPIKITLPFDPSRLPPQMSERDVYSFYFDDAAKKWRPVGRLSAASPAAERAARSMTSVTEHFTDFVNATRPLPEHPVQQLFNPSSMKDLKLADPAAGVDLIQVPKANANGSAQLAYPLELPPARHENAPALAFTYGSDQANGWLGVGWNLAVSAIEIDTRFGVPLYNGTEIYLLDGEMLSGPDPLSGEFRRRVEGRFDRILRLGSDPTSFSWVVTDKDGTKYVYGESAAARLADPAPDRAAVVFRWNLERIEDVFGNRIELRYTRDAGDNGEPWVQLYPDRIDYTSHPSGLPAEYSVVFALEPVDRPDVIISGRAGFQVLTRKRLDFVDVKLAGDIIRRYDVAYQTGDFGKSLVSSIALLGAGAAEQLYAHGFSYHSAPRQGGLPDIFAPVQSWGQVLKAGGVARPEDGLSRADDRMNGGSASVGIGIGPISLTGGAGGFVGDDRMRLFLFDRHSDGLPDFLDQGGAGSRDLLLTKAPASGTFTFEPVTGLGPDSLGRTDRSGWTVEGGLNIGGLAGVAASYSRSTAEDTRIIADVNGDGFPDLLSADGGQVSARLGDGQNHFGPPQAIGQLSLGDIVLGNPERRAAAEQSLHRIDPLVRWTAPFSGTVIVGGVIQKLLDNGPGVVARIFDNGALLWTRTLTDMEPCEPAPGNGCGGGLVIGVAAGDRIITQLEAIGAPGAEDVAWDPTIAYQVDSTLAGLREPYGPPIYRFSQQDDHRLAGQPSVRWVASASGTVAVSGSVRKLPTSDDVTIQVIKRDPSDQSPTLVLSQTVEAALDAAIPVTLEVPVLSGESLTFEVTSDTTIDPARVPWNPTVTYTTYCRPDRNQNLVCGAVSCSVDAQGRPVGCQIANDPFPQVPIPGEIIAQEAQVTYPTFQLLPAVPTVTVLASGATTIAGTLSKGATAAPVVVLVQGVNRLHFKRVFAANESGSFPIEVAPTLGTGEQLFFTVASAVNPQGAITWTPTVNGAPAPVNLRFRDPAFADPFTDEPHDPMSGGFHRWFFGDWDGEIPFSEDGIVFPDPNAQNAFSFVVPLRQGTAAVPAPLWVGRGEGEYIAAGQQKPSRLASASTLVGNGSGGLDDLRIAETWNFNLGASVVGLGVDASTGDTTSVTDFFDVNGDHFADSIFADGVRYNDGQGLGPKFPVDFGFDNPRTIEHRGLRARAGVDGSLITVTDTAGETKSLVSTGFNVGTEYSMSATQVDFVDMNGDGLPDHVESRPGEGGIRVRLNLGYKFGKEILWPSADWSGHSFGTRADIVRGVFGDAIGSEVVRLHDTGSNSVGVGADVGIVGGGGGVVFTSARALVELIDLNGDGLPDQVMKVPDETGTLRVKLNLGNGFGPEERWRIPTWAGLDVDPPDYLFLPGGDALSFRRSQQFSASFSFKICFFVCVGASGFHAEGPDWSQLSFEDIDGDGRVDHVLKLDGNSQVYAKLNQVGKSNLLETVTRPLGGTISLDYQREGNRVAPGETPRVDMPQNQWVLASSTVTDGRGNSYSQAFDYLGSGFYDRVEREFLGYAHVVTTRLEDGSQIEEFFHNEDYYRKGLAFRTVEKDAAGNLFIVAETSFRAPVPAPPARTGTFFPAETSRTSTSYEGTTTDPAQVGKSTSEERDFDDLGNITSFIDRGEPGDGNADDVFYSLVWRRDLATHIMRPERIEARDRAGGLLRARTATYRVDGTPQTITDVVVGGKDPAGVAYTGADGANLTWRFSYDDVGNLVSVIDPALFTLAYEYDQRMRLYDSAVTDSFGYRSTSVPDYRFGTPAESTDVNGQKLQRVFDDFGRLIQVFGPNDVGAAEPTIAMEYGLEPGGAPLPVWAATRHKDDTRPGDPITTVSFIDGLGRIVQRKKDAEVDGGSATTVGMSVSGRIEFDARGRVAARGQPVFDTGPATALVDVPLKNPTRYEYDVLSRQQLITAPDGARSRIDFGFGTLDGAKYFQETITDALGETRTTLRTIRNEARAVIERNTIGGQLVTLMTRFAYNPLGELTQVVDAKGNVTTGELDTIGRLVALVNPDAGRTEWRYQTTGNLGARETANLRAKGALIRYSHTFNRLERIDYPDQPAATYSYGAPNLAGDANGNRANRIAEEENEAGRKERRYDRLGNVVDETTTLVDPQPGSGDPFTQRMQYRYDSFGRLLEMTFPGLGQEVVVYEYDAGGMVTAAQGHYSEPGDLNPQTPVDTPYLLHIGYDEFGQRVRIVYGNGIETRYAYEPLMRRLSTVDADNQDGFMRQHGEPPRPFQRLRYQYDLIGNVLELDNDIPVPAQLSGNSMQIGPTAQTFHYDHLYQLTAAEGLYQAEAKRQFRSSLTLAYDEIGNIVNKAQRNQREDATGNGFQIKVVPESTYALDYRYDGPRPHAPTHVLQPGVKPPKDADLTFGYDADGNQVGRTQRGDRAPTVAQVWDAEDRLKQASAPSAVQEMLYDTDGTRTHSLTREKLSVYVNPNLTITDERVHSKHIYAGDLRIATKVEPQVGPRPATFFYHSDHVQSTHVVSDEDQFLTEHDEYFASGELWVEEGRPSETLSPRYLFTGKELDSATGYYYFGARYYDPRLGQWISPDPALGRYFLEPTSLVRSPLDLSLYSYANSNPISFFDPYGLDAWSWFNRNVVPRAVGVAKAGVGLAGMAVGAGLCDTIAGCVIGGPLLLASADYGGSGLGQVWYGERRPTLAGQVAGPKAEAIEGQVVEAASIAAPLARVAVAATVERGAAVAATKAAGSAETSAAGQAAELKPYGGPGGGHHVPAKAAFRDAAGYDANAALAVPNAELARLGVSHSAVTTAQMQGYRALAASGGKLTWESVATIETNALVRGGMNADMARATVKQAIEALQKGGVPGPTRIPWGGQ